MNQDIKALFDKLQEDKAALAAEIAPLRARYDELAQIIAPLDKEQRELAQRIRALEVPGMVDLDTNISGLAKLLGGRRMSDS